MTFLSEFVSNYMLLCGVIAYFTAQILKVIIVLVREKRIDLSLMFASGGMPSSHSSTVTALCIAAGRLHGIGSPWFAVTFILASIVMYDAAGVRRETGEHAKILNKLLEDITSGDHERTEEVLKELIGHTPLQVFMGAILGIIIPFLVPVL